MKNLLTALLPAMALLALGGCASTSAIATSEDDGVYYSSKDRTTAIVSASPAPASTDEAANPDYNGNQPKSSARQGSGSDQYYDNTYTYMQGVPSYGRGLAYYTPYSPYTSLSYNYGWGGGACGFSPYAYGFADPFYSPFYSPYYGYGSGLSITFGFGRSWGYGGYGSYYGYGRPYGGYGYSAFYDPYYYGGPFYGGYYGRGGYYGNSYYGGGNYGYSNGNGGRYYGNDNGSRGRTPVHRNDRSSDGRASGGIVSGGGGSGGVITGTPAPRGGERTRDDLRSQPSDASQALPGGVEASRTRPDVLTANPGTESPPTTNPTINNGRFNRPRGLDRTTATDQQPDANPAAGQVNREVTRGRWRNLDAPAQTDPGQPVTSQPQEQPRRRGSIFQNQPSEPANNQAGQVTEQPQQRRRFEQPQQRAYEQPQQQRSYEQPQQQRSYEQPQQRSYSQPSQPSYSAPANGGGGGGGGRSRGRAD